MTIDQKRYAEMAERAETREPTIDPDTVIERDPEGRDETLTMLLDAADTEAEREHIPT